MRDKIKKTEKHLQEMLFEDEQEQLVQVARQIGKRAREETEELLQGVQKIGERARKKIEELFIEVIGKRAREETDELFKEILKPTREAQKALKSLGIDFSVLTAKGEREEIEEFFSRTQKIIDLLKAWEKWEKTAVLDTITWHSGMPAMTPETWEKYLELKRWRDKLLYGEG